MLPLLFVSFSRKKPRQVLLYSAAITGGSCRSLTFRLGAPLRSHLPFTLSLPSQPPGILCNDSRACTLFVTVFLFMTIVYRSIYVCICKVCKFYFFRYKKSSVKCEKYHWFLCSLFFTISILLFCAYSTTF